MTSSSCAPNRTCAISTRPTARARSDANVILAVGQGLVRFKPGSTDWAPDAAADIKQVSDTLIEFNLKPGLKFTGGYGDLTANDVKFSFERFIKPGPDGKKVTYASDWSRPRQCRGHRPALREKST